MRVIIIAARTWGRLGNFAAAQNIARLISADPSVTVSVHAVEEFWPDFGIWGERMRSAATLDSAVDTSFAFSGILAEIDALTVKKNRQHPEWLKPVSKIAKFLSEQKPNQVIATKGLITRLAAAGREFSGQSFLLINWITNSGLIPIRCHRAPMADRHLVPLPEDRDYLIREWNVRPRNVRVIGPVARLSKTYGNPIEVDNKVSARRTLLYLHVVTHEALDQLESLLNRDTNVECVVLHSYGKPCALDRLLLLQDSFPARFSVNGELSQEKFHKLFEWLKEACSHLFVAKSGPNTMFEAMLLGLPMMLYRSGLPQEDWVLSYLHEREVGVPNTDIRELASTIIEVLDAPERQHAMLMHQQVEMERLEQLSDLKPSQFTSWINARRVAA